MKFHSLLAALTLTSLHAAEPPKPTHGNVSYGSHPHQLIDIHLPPKGVGPFPVLLWAIGFQKLALAVGATCLVKYPGHPTVGYDDIWNFIVKQLTSQKTAL